jgi:hypothetical protein
VHVLITGPQGFERAVLFAVDEDPAASANGFGRGSARDGIVGSLRGTMRDKRG